VRRHFAFQKHQKVLCDKQIPPDAKTKVWRNKSRRAFYGNRTHEHEK
jgi:hypothetical protein